MEDTPVEKNVAQRILDSKKAVIALVTVLGDLGLVWGLDVPVEQITEGIGLVWNGLGALLISVQGLLDIRWGSPSDGTA